MKPSFIILFIALFMLSACDHNQQSSKEARNISENDTMIIENPAGDTLYYLYTSGNKNQDTQALKISIINNQVTGSFMYMPAEKDWKFGVVNGKLADEELHLKWIFFQEGFKDSTHIVFRKSGNNLLQQETQFDEEGKEFTPEHAEFKKVYTQTDKQHFPKHHFDLGIL